jgi:hypothetical protein
MMRARERAPQCRREKGKTKEEARRGDKQRGKWTRERKERRERKKFTSTLHKFLGALFFLLSSDSLLLQIVSIPFPIVV